MNKRSYKKQSYKKRSYKKRSYKKRSYTRRRLHKTQNDFVSLPKTKGVPIFSNLDTKHSNKNYINTQPTQFGNIINGLRNYYEKKGSLV